MESVKLDLDTYENQEDERYLKEQIITYLGNKRTLLGHIEGEIEVIKEELNKEKLSCVDLFTGSGVVARMLKQHSHLLLANDLEYYSCIINECYLTNKSDFDEEKYQKYYDLIISKMNTGLKSGIISKNYAPKDDENIKKSERAFYTTKNAQIIDTIREAIEDIEDSYKKFFLAPLLYKASVHTNTSGVFKGFYKDSKTGKGKFGGNGGNALNRIKGEIVLEKPILSNFECEYKVTQEDSNELVKELKDVDVVYMDPPYNQHPYGSNYFMLNVIAKNELDTTNISEVSGIPSDWNRSQYNKKKEALSAMDSLIKNTNSKYILVSYNSEGFISFEEMKNILEKYGDLRVKEINYNTFKGSRNLKNRDIYVSEYIFTLKKGD